jgi:hypothetical protein
VVAAEFLLIAELEALERHPVDAPPQLVAGVPRLAMPVGAGPAGPVALSLDRASRQGARHRSVAGGGLQPHQVQPARGIGPVGGRAVRPDGVERLDMRGLDMRGLDMRRLDMRRLDVRRLDVRRLDVRRLPGAGRAPAAARTVPAVQMVAARQP